MSEEKINAEINFETGNIEQVGGNLGNNFGSINASAPAKVSVWTRLKGFLLQDVSEIKLELTPGEKKFVDFWTQEVTIEKAYNFLFQEIKFK